MWFKRTTSVPTPHGTPCRPPLQHHHMRALRVRCCTARAPRPRRGNYEWSNTGEPSQTAPTQTAHRTREKLVASTRPVFRGFSLWLPTNPRGFSGVFVLSCRPPDGCNYHREGPQIYPKFAPRAHRGKSALLIPRQHYTTGSRSGGPGRARTSCSSAAWSTLRCCCTLSVSWHSANSRRRRARSRCSRSASASLHQTAKSVRAESQRVPQRNAQVTPTTAGRANRALRRWATAPRPGPAPLALAQASGDAQNCGPALVGHRAECIDRRTCGGRNCA